MLGGDFLFLYSEPKPANTASVPTGAVWVGTLPKANCSRLLRGNVAWDTEPVALTDFLKR